MNNIRTCMGTSFGAVVIRLSDNDELADEGGDLTSTEDLRRLADFLDQWKEIDDVIVDFYID